jgi:DNA polymerase III alpha subunit
MLCQADTIGVFQVESRAQMNFLPRLQPRCFYDLVIQVAIVRPGPIQGDMVHPYIKRRNGEEPVIFPSKELKKILDKTLGVPLFQEQAIQIAMIAAGFSLKDTDKLRRSLAKFKKNGTVNKFQNKFVQGMIKNGYQSEFAERCFSQISGFSEYGFPESHAASFAILVYASAWIKNHYPHIFACALLNSQPMGFYSSSQIIRDAEKHGVKIKKVCINHSEWDHSIESDFDSTFALRLGFRQIKGLSLKDANTIINKRGNGYQDTQELWYRAHLTPSIIRILIKANCFHSFKKDRRMLLWKSQNAQIKKPLALFGSSSEEDYFIEKEVRLPKMTSGEELVMDYQSLKLSLDAHPLKLLRPFINKDFVKVYCR